MKKGNRSAFQLVTAIILSCFLPAMVFAWPVPDTGQSACYDDTGNAIPCPSPGQPFYGQDGNYTINPMSYTRLDAAGNALPADAASWVMVRDNLTGLIWEIKQDKDGTPNYANPHDADNTYTWYDSNPATNGGDAGTPGDGTDTEDFINALNAANYGGNNDWRLPTITELESIVNYGIEFPEPTINEAFFPNTAESWYRSSTTMSDDQTVPLDLSFFYGFGVYYFSKDYAYSARAVRGDGLKNQLKINKNGTVTDTETGLMWQQTAPDGTHTWQQGLEYAENLTLAGYNDWRMPTIRELQTLVNHSGDPVFSEAFPDMMNPQTSPYWSSTSFSPDATFVWSLLFDHNNGEPYDKKDPGNIRAVRGGQAGSADSDDDDSCFIKTMGATRCQQR